MSTLVEWFPASGSTFPFTTGNLAPARLISMVGLEPVSVTPVAIKSPNQPGDTAVDVVVPGRTVGLSGLLQTNSPEELWHLRRQLMRAMVQQPTRLGESYALGRLRVTIDNEQPLELECVPLSTYVGRPAGAKSIAPFDLEFYAPNPYWREIADTQIIFSGAGGFGFSVIFPESMASNNVQVDLDNQGDVDAPILARMYGDVTTARIMNLTTNETLEISGNIPNTQYIEISTAFGDKRIDLVTIATEERVSIMDRLNLAKPDFWSLRPGLNTVKFEADINVSGRGELYWRQRHSGF